jgi:hypothetical protein
MDNQIEPGFQGEGDINCLLRFEVGCPGAHCQNRLEKKCDRVQPFHGVCLVFTKGPTS